MSDIKWKIGPGWGMVDVERGAFVGREPEYGGEVLGCPDWREGYQVGNE